jgi:hypothetical protein
MTQYEELYALPAAVTKSSFTTATQTCISALASTSVPRCILPLGYWTGPGKTLRIYAAGSVSNLATAATFIFAAGLDVTAGTIAGSGGTTLFTSAALTPTASVVCPWELRGEITCQAAGSGGTTLQFNGNIVVNNVASSGAWGTGTQGAYFANNLTGLNSEISTYLELFGTFTGTTTGCTTILQQFKVFGEN